MANEVTYYDTDFTFISPVRHYKANDPYYYEVDNIPIKQLEESSNFLKDQVDGIITKQNNRQEIEIDRSGFSELKPYSTGLDRKVRVKPGKYSSRINNAYDITPLQVISQIAGFTNTVENDVIAPENQYRVGTVNTADLQSVLDQFQDGLNGDALNMNGLAERAFVFPIADEDVSGTIPDVLNVTDADYRELDSDFPSPDDRPLYPNFIGAILKHTTDVAQVDLKLIKNIFGEDSAGAMGRLESAFIKRWRGVTRTSIVDVPNELDIVVPDFEAANDDFFYIDANGTRVTLPCDERIDLIFIYSKAVDESRTTIPKFDENGQPTVLLEPALGVVKGAGLGISRQTASNDDSSDDRVSLSLDGVPLMLSHPGDQGSNANNGFATSAGIIRGAFPSPDDLMNLAPVLSENLESTAYPLIGQSILPVAYVRVTRRSGELSNFVDPNDIIDIRPFFRTTELAYNERAGIAAATPQVSIANPVVTEAHLEKVKNEIYTDLRARIPETPGGGGGGGGGNNQSSQTGGANIVAAGVITGGYRHGAEGALVRQYEHDDEGYNTIIPEIESEFGYPTNSIGARPMWDKASWYTARALTDDRPTDCINFSQAMIVAHANPKAAGMVPWKYNTGPTIPTDNPDDVNNSTPGVLGGGMPNNATRYETGNFGGSRHGTDLTSRKFYQIAYVSKKIQLANNTNRFYHVNVNYLNCCPLTQHMFNTRIGNPPQAPGSYGGTWVVKHPNYFIINVAWPILYHNYNNNDDFTGNSGSMPWLNRDDAQDFMGFCLPEPDVRGGGEKFNVFGPRMQYDKQDGRRTGSGNAAGQTIGEHIFNRDFRNRDVNITDYQANTPFLYPSVSFEVISYPDGFYEKAMGADGQKLFGNLPVIDLDPANPA